MPVKERIGEHVYGHLVGVGWNGTGILSTGVLLLLKRTKLHCRWISVDTCAARCISPEMRCEGPPSRKWLDTATGGDRQIALHSFSIVDPLQFGECWQE